MSQSIDVPLFIHANITIGQHPASSSFRTIPTYNSIINATTMQRTLIEVWTHGEHKSHTLRGATTATVRIDNGEHVRPQLRTLRPPTFHCKSVDEANQRASLRAIERGLKYALDEWNHLQLANVNGDVQDDESAVPAEAQTPDHAPSHRNEVDAPRNLDLRVYTTSQYAHDCMTHNAIRLDKEHFWDAKQTLLNNTDVVKDILKLEKELDEGCDSFAFSYHLVEEELDMRAIRALRAAIPARAKLGRGEGSVQKGGKRNGTWTRDSKGKRKACRRF